VSALRLVIADDFAMMIELIGKMCRQDLGIEVVGEATTGGQAVDLICRTQPDVVLLDLNLPGFDGFQVIEAIRRFPRTPKVIVLSAYCSPFVIHRIEGLRVAGYLYKPEISVATLRSAILSVAKGATFFSDTFLANKAAAWKDTTSPFKLLTDRETEILVLVGDSLTDLEIARQLEVSERTVEKHRLNITAKLALGGRVELQRFAREQGFGTHFA
jgi:DNA-binding NarL/FixJ family response regulator